MFPANKTAQHRISYDIRGAAFSRLPFGKARCAFGYRGDIRNFAGGVRRPVQGDGSLCSHVAPEVCPLRRCLLSLKFKHSLGTFEVRALYYGHCQPAARLGLVPADPRRASGAGLHTAFGYFVF
jgi:hypothetical protein